MNDTPTELWLAHLRAEVPWVQGPYGGDSAPASAKELADRLRAAQDDLRAAVDRCVGGGQLEDGAEPDWFVVLADRVVPHASWMMGVGSGGANELPEGLREFAERARKVPGVGQALRLLGDLREQLEQAGVQNERLRKQVAESQAGYFLLLRVHTESVLAPLAGEGGTVTVRFEFPAQGQRVAELAPPPSAGSPTSGTVGRVLAPAVLVTLTDAKGEARIFSRGAHLRGR